MSMPPSLDAISATRLRRAVGDHRDVVLLLDVGAFLDQQAPHLLAFGAGLVRDRAACRGSGWRASRTWSIDLRDLDAAALAAAAGVDLRLDDPDRAAELLRRLDGLVDA